MMASLSSKSLKRFLVNFQMRKPTIPKAATPPATERPIIDPVPSPLSPLLLLLLSAPLVADEEGEEVALDIVSVTTTVSPPAFTEVTTDVAGGATGVVDVDNAVFVPVDLAVSEGLVGVVLVLEAVVAVLVLEVFGLVAVVAVLAVVAVFVADAVVAVELGVLVLVLEVAAAVAVLVEALGSRMELISARAANAFGTCAAPAECIRAKARKHERSSDLDPFISTEL